MIHSSSSRLLAADAPRESRGASAASSRELEEWIID
ncbi:hypothetical protein, partial [Pseudomonas sp. 3PA37B6]